MVDINTLLNADTKLFDRPPTQEDHYIENNSHPKIIKLSGMHNKTYGAKLEGLSRLQFNMDPSSSSGWDHNKNGKRIEQKSIRRSAKGVFGSYMHIEPTHEWDYLMLVNLEYQRWNTYIVKKSSIQDFIREKSKFISIQGDGVHSHEGYLLKHDVPDNIREQYYTRIETEEDLINFIHQDLVNT